MLGYDSVAGYFEQTVAKLKQFEGCVPWMYRDTAGNVTVGVGLMLPDPAAACALPFVMAAGPANLEQIAAEFERVESLPPGKLPDFYKTSNSPELPQRFIDAKLSSVLGEMEVTLREKLPIYDHLPDGVKMVLLDMAYNLGPGALLTGYPHMMDAIEIGAWPRAAAESEREGISAARNAWAKQQFLSTVVETIRAEAAAGDRAAVKALEEAGDGGFWRKLRKMFSGK
jgi:GH24 family phage-related lysozyme (muramidase)